MPRGMLSREPSVSGQASSAGEREDIPHQRRRVLCIFPPYQRSFGTFHYAYPLLGGVRAFMPPQGLLVIAAYLPRAWEVRFVDENIGPATPADYRWADVVLASGMHIQRTHLQRINALAHQAGKLTVLGGPSVSAAPEDYPEFDMLHIGELGDATDELIAYLDHHIDRPARQLRFETQDRLPLHAFPVPAYHLVDLRRYFLANVQFSSGCPYRCEFCDIPALYGRNPRLKTPAQVLVELDAMLAAGNPGAIYFVDDNFVGNRRAVSELLPELIAWQQRRGYPVSFACEATLNLAQSPQLLAMMREAHFHTVFCGVETPEPHALRAMAKEHNLRMPIIDAVQTLNAYGMEVVAGIILGLDTDTPETAERILAFIQHSQIPMLTINVLYALPKTPLWHRLKAAGRLIDEAARESNIEFLMPYDEVIEMWRRCITTAYEPEYLYRRFAYQGVHTYPHRLSVPNSPARTSWANLRQGLTLLTNLLLRVGLLGTYRQAFWSMALPALKSGDIARLLQVGAMAHHLIRFTQDCVHREESASFYSQKDRRYAAQFSRSRAGSGEA
jgi:hopanoid C-2 methylase